MGGEAGAGTATEGGEDEESLEPSANISQLPDPVQHQVHDLLPDGVVAPGVVVGGVLLAGDKLLGGEELPVDPGSHLVDDGGLQVHKDSPGDVLASTGLGEEGVEAVISSPNSLVRWHAAIRLDPVLQAVELPASVTNLDTGLSDMDRNAFPHGGCWRCC